MFVGKHRIDRNDMDEMEERVMKALDIICFKGNHHMKRGHGLLSFPHVLLPTRNSTSTEGSIIMHIVVKR